jgi:hypothetical protein
VYQGRRCSLGSAYRLAGDPQETHATEHTGRLETDTATGSPRTFDTGRRRAVHPRRRLAHPGMLVALTAPDPARHYMVRPSAPFTEALDLPGWEDYSIWGYDEPLGSYFAQLWHNSSGGPDEP